jgi:glycerol transport system permease protein
MNHSGKVSAKTRVTTLNKVPNNKAWWLVLPMFLLVAFSAIIPLMTVVNYSLQDIFDQNTAYFVGVEWYQETLRNTRLHDSLLRQFGFSFSVLIIEIPLGIAVALMMPQRGWQASAVLILLALPLLIPWNVVGTIWQVFARGDIGLFGWTLNNLGIDYNYTSNPLDAWLTVLLMDVWHWTSLVALLCYSGLRAIPDAYYQAAKIDRASAWAVFRYIQLPRLRNVLVIGVLLRFMDSFMIYTEPFVLTGGGPGTSTTFLSQTLTQMAIGQFDIGPAAAFSLVYFLIVLLVSWVFFTTITHMEKSGNGNKHDK